MPQIALLVAQVIFATLIAAPVYAHAVLMGSSPKDKAVLAAPPQKVVLRFNARIEKQVSQVTLLDGKGRTVSLPPAPHGYTAGPPDQLIIPMPSLKPGNYRLKYRIMATDGHVTPGLIRFTVSGRSSK
jgi:methionine-rich copper-binding protein CopC